MQKKRKMIARAVILLFLLIASAAAAPPQALLSSEFSTIPNNYTFPIKSVQFLESTSVTASSVSIRDRQGSSYTCFATGNSFSLSNTTYTPARINTFLLKLNSDLKVVWIKEYTEINSRECKKMILDNQEENVYLELQNFQIAKVDVTSGNATLVWTSPETNIESWDIVDIDQLIVAHRVGFYQSPTALFRNVCPFVGSNEYTAIGIVNTTSQSLLSYQCFTNQLQKFVPTHISYSNGKVYLFGKYTNHLILYGAQPTLLGVTGEETGFFVRLDWLNGTTDFAMNMGHYATFSHIHYAKNHSFVSFALHNTGVGIAFDKRFDMGVYFFKVSLPQASGVPPQLMYHSPKVSEAALSTVFAHGINPYGNDSPSVVLFRYEAGDHNLALIPIERGLYNNWKDYPMQLISNDLQVRSVMVHNNGREVTVVFSSANSFLVSGVQPVAGTNQLAFVTLTLPTVPVRITPPVVIQRTENVETTFADVMTWNGTHFFVNSSITVVTSVGVHVVLHPNTTIETTDTALRIDLLESFLNAESYTSEVPPKEFDVFAQSNSSTVIGQLVGNGYQVNSNAIITNAQICIPSAMKRKQSWFINSAMATQQGNRLQMDTTLQVTRVGNQFCTRVDTASPVLYPALVGVPPASTVTPQASTTPLVSSAWTGSVSLAVVFLAVACF